jgi:hypothetical protein
MQSFYVVALRLTADFGVGAVTLFSYAYMGCAMLVAVTASSMSLVSSAPLTRRTLDAGGAAAHVVHTSWLSLAVVAGAAAAAAVAGDGLALVLGPAFGGEAGRQLGLLILCLGPWTVATIVLSVSLPLLFVAEGPRFVGGLAGLAVAVHVAVSLVLRTAAGLAGIELALAVSTMLLLAGVMARLSPRALSSAPALGAMVATEGGLALVAFGGTAAVLGRGVVAALSGVAVYVILHALLRPRGLARAWVYLRQLQDPPSSSR